MIRPAREADDQAVIAMAEKFYATTAYPQFAGFHRDSVASIVKMCRESGILLLAEHKGRPVGMVALIITPFMFNHHATVAYEVAWYVEPEAQGLGIGKTLFASVEPHCKNAGCCAIQMVHLANSPPQAAMVYERGGFQHTESSHTKVLIPWPQSQAQP